MELVLFVVALVALDVLALRFGRDSRALAVPRPGYEPFDRR
jgi:hypothetical protein